MLKQPIKRTAPRSKSIPPVQASRSTKTQPKLTRRQKQKPPTIYPPIHIRQLNAMEQLEAEIAYQQPPIDWDYTDPVTGTLNCPGYENVLINPDLLLKGPELEAHYAQAWDLYQNKMKSPKTVCAPMVEQSELPFRLLSRKYNIELTYTPMINSNPTFKHTIQGLNRHFETCPEEEGSLTIQVCGANIQGLFALGAKLEQMTSNATDININLGCPQGIAKRGRYGSYLLEDTIHVQRVIRSLKDILHVPITVKMRKLLNDPTYERTLAYARALQDSGASIITLHGRTRNNKQDKIGQADLEAIRQMKATLKVPCFANGGVGSYFDLKRIQDITKVDAVMISEGLLGFPSLIAYPIRRAQLLGKGDRPPTDEGFYAGIHQLESTEDRQHYSYPQFDDREIKDIAYHQLDERFKLLPKLHSRSSLQELQYIDYFTGPDPHQIASELTYITSRYSNYWQQSLRPHLFKILHRELACHTDLRMAYSMCAVTPKMDTDLIQILRHRDRYVWNKYKDEILSKLYVKLSTTPELTKLDELDTSNLSDDDLSNLLSDFDFKALAEHLDTYPWFAQELEVRKQLAQSLPTDAQDDETKTAADDGAVAKPSDLLQTVVVPDQTERFDHVPLNHRTKEAQQNRLAKLEFRSKQLQRQHENEERQKQLQQQHQQQQHQQQQQQQQQQDQTMCMDSNHDDKCQENKINEAGNESSLQAMKKAAKKAGPQLLDTHPYPASTNPWVHREDYRILDIVEQQTKKGPSFRLAHRFSRDSWHETYRKFCLDNGFLTPTGDHIELTLNNHGENVTVQRPTYLQTEKGYNANHLIHNHQHLPEISGLIKNSQWTVRNFEDLQWARLFRLDRPTSTVSDEYHNQIKLSQYPGQANITPMPLDHYIIPMPLESTWFFEKLYAQHNFWYYRYEHVKEILHLYVDEDSIKDQLYSMVHARKQKVDNIQQFNEKSGPSLEQQQKHKEQKLARKAKQRQEEIDKKNAQESGQVTPSPIFSAESNSSPPAGTIRPNPPLSTPTKMNDGDLSGDEQPIKRQRQMNTEMTTETEE